MTNGTVHKITTMAIAFFFLPIHPVNGSMQQHPQQFEPFTKI